MTTGDAGEAFAALDTLLAALLGSVAGQSGQQTAALAYAVGDLRATGLAQIRAGTLALPLLNCFMLAFYAGASLAGMDQVRALMEAQTPTGNPGKAVATAGVRFALGREARILAGTTFTSSDAVFAALAAVNDAFESAEDYAADNRDPTGFQALIAMHAAVVRDLTTRAVVLPKLVTFTVPVVMTSHALANRLYGDASRCDELWAENPTPHPAFMPTSGTCLSE